jgi:hypothetical protein
MAMFPFFGPGCCSPDANARRDYQERKLKFMKWFRDDLETRLAALNAAISTLERQMGQEPPASN